MPEGDVCIPNIGAKGRAMRMRFGATMLAVGVAVEAALVLTGAARAWRLGLFFAFWLAGVGYFQAREKT